MAIQFLMGEEKYTKEALVSYYLENVARDTFASYPLFGGWIEAQIDAGLISPVYTRGEDQYQTWHDRTYASCYNRVKSQCDQQLALRYSGRQKRKEIRGTREYKDMVNALVLKEMEAYTEGYWEEHKGDIIREAVQKDWKNFIYSNHAVHMHNSALAEKATEGLDMEDEAARAAETVFNEMNRDIDRWLSTGRIFLYEDVWDPDDYDEDELIYIDDDTAYVRHELTPDNIEPFLSGMLAVNNTTGWLMYEVYGEQNTWLMDHVRAKIMDSLPVPSGLDAGLRDIIRDKYGSVVEDYAESAEERFCFGREYVFSRIMENPHYKKACKEKAEKDRKILMLQASILRTMPETYPELYPLARKMKRRFILHIGPTNSGKTYAAMQALREAGEGIYLAPLRLLAFEQYEQLNADGFPCSLVTGEEREIREGAKIQSSTVEMMDPFREYPAAVIDEAQLVMDPDRGWAWTDAILGLRCKEIHVCAAPQAEERILKMIGECGDDYEIVRHERQTPLVHDMYPFSFPEDVRKHDALIVFSKRNVHAVAYELRKRGVPCSIIYGNLPYDVRQAEARKFASGETDVLVSTDAIGMGLNLPIRRIVFLEISKFDGTSRRILRPEEAQQIAGRAGRMGIFPEGSYTHEGPLRDVVRLVEAGVPAVKKAVIGFPEALIHLDGRISEIIGQWEKLPEKPGYKRMNTGTLKRLVLELEQKTDNKQLIYDFATLPFNPDGEEKEIWNAMVRAELSGKRLSLKGAETVCPLAGPGMNLNELEHAHKVCDLLYGYNMRFSHPEDIEEIMETKKAISGRILKELSSRGLQPRRCKYCGEEMPWNYPYGICQSCHDERFGFGGYYDDWY